MHFTPIFYHLFLACVLLVTGVCAHSSTNEPRITCATPNYEFGKVCNTVLVTHVFLLANEGTAPLTITSLNSGCGCTVAKSSVTAIQPGSNTEVTVKFDTANRTGPQRKIIYVQSNDPHTPTLRLELTGDLLGRTVGTVVPTVRGHLGDASLPGETVGTVAPTVRGRLGEASLPKTDTLTDLYTIPTELTVVTTAKQTNTVCRMLAIRSHSGKPFRVESVELPEPGMVANLESTLNGTYRCAIRNISPSTNLNGRSITIHTDRSGERAIHIPIRVVMKGTKE